MATNIENETEFTDELVSEWILHGIFNNSTYLESISKVNNEHWYSDADIGVLISIVINYYKRHHEVPTIEAVAGNIEFLAERGRIKTPTVELIRKFTDIVTKHIDVDDKTIEYSMELFVKKSGMFQTLTDYISAKSDVSKKKSKVTFDSTYNEIAKFYDFRLDNDIGLDYFNQFDKQLDYLMKPDSRLKTGIDAIDTWSNGGIPSAGNCLCAFQAGTNVGKTLFLGNVAYNMLKQDKCVVIVTMEISALGYGRRLSALLSGCNVDCLAAYHEEMEGNIKKFKEEHPSAQLIIKEYPMHGTTTSDIDTYIENLKHDGINPDLVIVDYLNLLTPSFCSKNEQQWIKVAIVSEQLRAISKKYEIPIFTATQSSRSSLMDQETKLADMSQSLGLAVAADLILGLYCFTEEANVVHMNCIKNRFGSKNYVSRMYRIDQNTLEPIDIGDASSDDNEVIVNPIVTVQSDSKIANAQKEVKVAKNDAASINTANFPPPSSIGNDEFDVF